MNREEWLNTASQELQERFHLGDLNVHVSVGFPSRGGLSSRKRVVGECWKPEVSRDGRSHVFISPLLEEPTYVLAVLLHELIHAWDRGEHGHRGAFVDMAKKVGLEKPWTSTRAGVDLQQRLVILANELGIYPHVILEPKAVERKVQSTRMIKLTAPCCGYIVRTTQKWLDMGLPSCPCGTEMELEAKKEDE